MGFTQITQKSWRHYSKWHLVYTTQNEVCCDCGLTHTTQYKLMDVPGTNECNLYLRTRRHKAKTASKRKLPKVKSKLRRLSSAAS